MRKFPLSSEQMSDVSIEDVQQWANSLIRGESRGPGDLENAMRRIEVRYGISYSTLWRLRYRKPKDVLLSAAVRIQAAYLAECERHQRHVAHERKITEAKGWVAKAFARAGDVLAGSGDEPPDEIGD